MVAVVTEAGILTRTKWRPSASGIEGLSSSRFFPVTSTLQLDPGPLLLQGRGGGDGTTGSYPQA